MDLEMMRQHLGMVSILGASASVCALVLVLGGDILLTLVHSMQELHGRLWRYFGAIVGLQIPDWLGFSLFFVVLTTALWSLAWAGIAGWVPFLGNVAPEWTMAAVGALIGARLADGIFSHVHLHRKGYRPNPGLASIPFYFAEALVLAVLFSRGLRNHGWWGAAGFGVGFVFFYIILPALRLVRANLPGALQALRRDPWQPGQRIPEWAR